MALTLTLTDAADGSGFTGAVTGADAATVTVYTHQAGDTAWAVSGTRTGNGTLALATGTGYFSAYAAGTVSGSPAASLVVTGAATSGTQSLHEREMLGLAAAFQAAVAAAGFPGFSSDHVTVALAINPKLA